MPDMRTTKGREAERHRLKTKWMGHSDSMAALDGLDIAQEMAKEMALWRGNKPYSYCDILAKWDNWQKGQG